MTKLHFNTPEEFSTLFKTKNERVTDTIVVGIRTALEKKKKIADLFEITFSDCEEAFIISLPSREWNHALSSCLDFYHANNCDPDKSIDTWKILEIVKTYD
jgi:hypothetical protein